MILPSRMPAFQSRRQASDVRGGRYGFDRGPARSTAGSLCDGSVPQRIAASATSDSWAGLLPGGGHNAGDRSTSLI